MRHGNVRSAAVESIIELRVIQGGDQTAVSQVGGKLLKVGRCDSLLCAQQAAEAFAEMVGMGGHFHGMPALLCADSARSRKGAVLVLAKLVPRGDESALQLLQAWLRDSDAGVRHAAAQALGQVAQWGDTSTCQLLQARLRDDDASVRQAAVQALGQVA